MDDEGEDISRRRLKMKSGSFVKTRSTSSCATPRYQWRSISWSTHSTPVQSPEEESSDAGNETGEDPESDGETQNLCPPLQSLSVSSSETKKFLRKGKNCLDIKLDLGVIEKSVPEEEPCSSELQPLDPLEEKVVEKDKHCTQILSHLFIGGRSVAQNYALLQNARITHILNCVGFCCPEYYPKLFTYRTLWLHDTPGEDIICVLYDVFDFLESVREQAGCQALVHCSEGVSRSAALIIAYLMWRDRKSYDQAFETMKTIRPSTNPNLGFVFQLMQWQTRICSGVSPGSRHLHQQQQHEVLNIYRMAPQSAYDPLYLVPKSVTSSGFSALDSRGAFVIQTGNRLYVWRGRSSDRGMAAAADKVAFQLIRYEHAHGPIVSVNEGSEPETLREELNLGLGASDPSGASSSSGSPERLVPLYDTDYEIYSKARAGEFLVPIPVRTPLTIRAGKKSPQGEVMRKNQQP